MAQINLKRRRSRVKKKAPLPKKPSMNDSLADIRDRVYMVMSILSVTRYASDSCINPKRGQPDLEGALNGAYELLDAVSDKVGALLPPDYYEKKGGEA